MSIRRQLKELLNESYEEVPVEPDMYTSAVQSELDEAVTAALQPQTLEEPLKAPPVSPDQMLDELIPTLVDAYTGEKTDTEKDHGTVKVLFNVYLSKLRDGIPLEHIMQNFNTHFALDAETQGKVETLFNSFLEQEAPDPLLEKVTQYAESIVPALTVFYRPGCGSESPEYAERAKKHTMDYIKRVNGEDITIDQALMEMTALFEFDDECRSKMENLLKVASGQLDETTLSFIEEMSVGTGSFEEDIPQEVERRGPIENDIMPRPHVLEEFESLCNEMVTLSENLGIGLHESDTDEAYAEDSYMYVAEAVGKAAAFALKQGAHRGAHSVIADLMNVMAEEFVLSEELTESLTAGLTKAFALGEAYSEDILQNESLFDEQDDGIDMTVDQHTISDMFGQDEPEIEEELPMEEEVSEKEVVNPYEKMYNERLIKAFENEQ